MDIGIDLGTTFSVIAVNGRVDLTPAYPQGVYLEDCDVTVIPTPEGEPTFPSVMVENPDRRGAWLFGREALNKAQEGLAPVMFSKRKIGTREQIPMHSGAIVARDFAREFLAHLKACAERALGQTVSRAVVTHPAYFDRSAVEETREAAQRAGFDMSLTEQMLMEPVAAALTYTRTDHRDPLRILTYDLGGGTFDVTYLERTGGVIAMRSFDGDHLLGGYNFDRELVHWLRQRIEAQGRRYQLNEDEPADRSRLARLLQLAENVKIALAGAASDASYVDFRVREVLVDTQGRPMQVNERITRAQFIALIQQQLNATVECCRRALEKAGVTVESVDEVLLAGGSTYGPWVTATLKAAFPQTSPKLFYPDLCVGAGAAIHAKMVLPSVVRGARLKLVLDVPEKTVLMSVNVVGQVQDDNGAPMGETIAARLETPTGERLGPVQLGKGGGFLFADVELQDDQVNIFKIVIESASKTSLLEHSFGVTQAGGTTETSSVTTVLPKPLFIETFDGLVPLAKEGASLPARCSQTFQRDNDNPNITLRLFQSFEAIGEVRIEKIPAEGGRGSYVDLEVEVTDKNQIRGHATVRTRDNRVVARSPVAVRFHVPEVPAVEELQKMATECGQQWALSAEEEDGMAGAADLAKVGELLQRVDHLFQQQPLEKQEIHVLLRQARQMLNPPKDLMRPTQKEFCELVEACRGHIRELEAQAQDVLARPDARDALAANLKATAEHNRKRVGPLLQTLDKLEQEGLSAHQKRDQRTWSRVHESVLGIAMQVQERPREREMPTPLLKMFGAAPILQALGQLEAKAQEIAGTARQADWRQEIDRLRQVLRAVLEEIGDINDDLPSAQGQAKVRLIINRALEPAQRDIERLGIDISNVARR